MCRESGFSLIELVTIVVILGILAVVAIPRLRDNDFRAQEFRDRTVSALRYAQKSAVSHRRVVCVTFAAASLRLNMDVTGDNACGAGEGPLMLPGTNGNEVLSANAAQVFFNPVPAPLIFQSNGSSGGALVSIPGQADIVVNGVTGYVE
ncbi:MAG TPA: type II secretion system protein [Rhodocyclaceae bacterium]|nr:type II secretion system protein [Rhodocyclaceae bacterium]